MNCNCGNKLKYIITPYMTAHKIVCPNCKTIHYVDIAPIDWKKIFNKERTYGR